MVEYGLLASKFTFRVCVNTGGVMLVKGHMMCEYFTVYCEIPKVGCGAILSRPNIRTSLTEQKKDDSRTSFSCAICSLGTVMSSSEIGHN